jgi:hypothetical protein
MVVGMTKKEEDDPVVPEMGVVVVVEVFVMIGLLFNQTGCTNKGRMM